MEGEGAEPAAAMEGEGAEEKIAVLQTRLQQSEMQCSDLKEELSRVKNECMELQGTKSGLQKRLSDQEEALIQVHGVFTGVNHLPSNFG